MNRLIATKAHIHFFYENVTKRNKTNKGLFCIHIT